MIIRSVELETVCGVTSTLPVHEEPEIAFAGKSNVGKSSLLNALVLRKKLARTSAQPGKTQTINFYHVNSVLYLVDLPGYGYAKASLKSRMDWKKLVERYLYQTRQLKLVLLLIDIRHEPGDNDAQMYRWVQESGFPFAIIATKADKLKKSQIQKHIRMIRNTLGAPSQVPVIPWSSMTRQGREEIWTLIEEKTTEQGAGSHEERDGQKL